MLLLLFFFAINGHKLSLMIMRFRAAVRDCFLLYNQSVNWEEVKTNVLKRLMHLFINTFIFWTLITVPDRKKDQDDKENASTKQKLTLIAFPLSFLITIMPNSDRLSHVPVLYGCWLLIATIYTRGPRLNEAVFPLFVHTKRLFPWRWGPQVGEV